MKNATRLAVCGISTALCVVLLFFGGVSFFLAYAMPMLAGMFMIMLKSSFGASAAWAMKRGGVFDTVSAFDVLPNLHYPFMLLISSLIFIFFLQD